MDSTKHTHTMKRHLLTLPDTTLAYIVSLLDAAHRLGIKSVSHAVLTATCSPIAWQHEHEHALVLQDRIPSLNSALGFHTISIDADFPHTRLHELSVLHASLHELDLTSIQLYAPHVIDTLIALVTNDSTSTSNNHDSDPSSHQPLHLHTLYLPAPEACHLDACAPEYADTKHRIAALNSFLIACAPHLRAVYVTASVMAPDTLALLSSPHLQPHITHIHLTPADDDKTAEDDTQTAYSARVTAVMQQLASLPNVQQIESSDQQILQADWDEMLQLRRDMLASSSPHTPALVIYIHMPSKSRDRIDVTRCIPSATLHQHAHDSSLSDDVDPMSAHSHSIYAAIDETVRIAVPYLNLHDDTVWSPSDPLTLQIFAQLESLSQAVCFTSATEATEASARYTALFASQPCAFPHANTLTLCGDVTHIEMHTALTTAWLHDLSQHMPQLIVLNLLCLDAFRYYESYDELFPPHSNIHSDTPLFPLLQELSMWTVTSPLHLLVAAPFSAHLTSLSISSCLPLHTHDLAAVCHACPALISLSITLATEEEEKQAVQIRRHRQRQQQLQQQQQETTDEETPHITSSEGETETRERFTQEHDEMARKMCPRLQHVRTEQHPTCSPRGVSCAHVLTHACGCICSCVSVQLSLTPLEDESKSDETTE